MARNPNRMQEAVSKVAGTFKTSASILVTYTQDSTVITDVSATEFRTPYEILDGGVLITYESQDFAIMVADLPGITPKSGDKITDANGRNFIVSMPGKMNVYEIFQGIEYKIHSKAVS